MNTDHTPQVGDVWKVCSHAPADHEPDQSIPFGREVLISAVTEHGILFYEKVIERVDGLVLRFAHLYLVELIERDGKRDEELWQEWTYDECPDYRKEQIKQAELDDFVIEAELGGEWVFLASEPKRTFVNCYKHRITNRKHQLPNIESFTVKDKEGNDVVLQVKPEGLPANMRAYRLKIDLEGCPFFELGRDRHGPTDFAWSAHDGYTQVGFIGGLVKADWSASYQDHYVYAVDDETGEVTLCDWILFAKVAK